MNSLIGKQIDHFRIDALLGEGGMGEVYRAFDLNLALPVALKVMHPHLAKQAQFKQRFMQEAQAAARLQHPSIVDIKYFGVKQGLLFMVMDLVSGPSLGAYVRRQAPLKQIIQLEETLLILAQVAEALDYAHRQGVVHRDIKPDNVLVQPLDEPKQSGEPALRAVVTDFGLAKLLEGGIETGTGSFMGTMPYMSPEQCLGVELDGRSDIYSLGIMLYQFATGRLPFEIKTPAEAAEKHLRGVPPDPRQIQPGLPESVEAIIQKAIAKDPAARYQRAADLAADIRRAAAGLTETEITQFAAHSTVISLMTQLIDMDAYQEPSRMGIPMGVLEQEDVLLIAHKDHTPLTIPLDKTRFVIGREASNDIVLPEAGISRRHARLDRTNAGWQVIDLRSTNGTTIDGQKLLPDVPEDWTPDQTLRLGAYFLHWKRATEPATREGTTAWLSALPGATQVETPSQQLSLTIHPTEMSLETGQEAKLEVEIFHAGSTVEHFRLKIDGLPGDWTTLPPDAVQLMPGGRVRQAIAIRPPRHSSAQAGLHTYRLVVQLEADNSEVAAVPARLEVLPFEQFSVDMQPSHLNSGAATRVTISNQGNAESYYSLVGRDPAEQVQFSGLRGRIKVAPGQTHAQPVTAIAKKRPWLGSIKRQPFELQVRSSQDASKRLNGELNIRPRFPVWALSLLGLLVLCVCAGGAFALNMGIPMLPTAQALATPITTEAPAVFDTPAVASQPVGDGSTGSSGDGADGLEPAPVSTNPAPVPSEMTTSSPTPTSTATDTPTATPTLAAPVGADISVQIAEDEPGSINVLANVSDSDGDLDPGSLSVSSGPAHGAVNSKGSGTLEYIPEPNYNGSDSFSYQICDTDSLCVTAAVMVAVLARNDLPAVSDDSGYQGEEDSPLVVAAPGVLKNDSDVDGDNLTALVESQPAHGTVSLKADGSFSFTPKSNYCGSDSFTYTASDGNGGVGTANVKLDVKCVNDKPTAKKDVYQDAIEDVVFKVAAPGVLGNDSDPDQGDKLTFRRVTKNPRHGTVAVKANGGFTYQPDLDFCSSAGVVDFFEYELEDSGGKRSKAEAHIIVRCVIDRQKYKITLKTGDRKNAETDAAVFIRLFGTQEVTPPVGFRLDTVGVDDHERNRSYEYIIETNDGIGDLDYAEIWLANGSNKNTDGWFMEYVRITRLDTGFSEKFTCNQWFDADDNGNITKRRLDNGGCG